MEVTLTQENFDAEVLKSTIPVLVDFWAVWCGPCKLQNPILEELTKELAGKVKIANLNVDEYPDLASTYNVMSIPTLKFFNKGQVMSEMIGLQSRERLLSEIQKISQ
jgi:thioredoxin 1